LKESQKMSINISQITKFYGSQKALDNVDFELRRGELTGFLGPNGAGKSTLMKIITGYLLPDQGIVSVNGNVVNASSLNIRCEIGYLPENNPLYTDLYVREYLEITAGFYKLYNKRQSVSRMVELTGLGNEQHKKIAALSKGYRQRVGLAQALIHDPSVLILDEPTTGLDPNQLEEIRRLIREISSEKTVLLSSHIMQEVEAMCNRVIIINKGIVVADGPLAEIRSLSVKSAQTVFAQFDKPFDKNKLAEKEGIKKALFHENKWIIEAEPGKDIRPEIFKFAVENNLVLLALGEQQQNLENVFQELTRK
jgi:ABC-2 type transport system ATP-binding protein